MLLKRRTNSATLWRSAMGCLLAFFAVTLISRSARSDWQDLLDGVRGAMLGATLGLMVLTAVVQRRR
jgi:hypothetical protein